MSNGKSKTDSSSKHKKKERQPGASSTCGIDRSDAVTGGSEATAERGNPGATPGSTQGGTLAGTPGHLAGGSYGREPQAPTRIAPYGTWDVTPIGTEEAILGTTVGDLPEGETGESVTDSAAENELGSTIGGRPGSMTGNRRALQERNFKRPKP